VLKTPSRSYQNVCTGKEAVPMRVMWWGVWCVLVTSWVLFWGVDALNLWGTRERFAVWSPQHPLTFLWFFNEGRLAETLQWLLLSVALVVAVALAFQAWRRGDLRGVGTYTVGGSGLLVMLLEDAINLRHELYFRIMMPLRYDERVLKSAYRSLVELGVYGLLGGLMLLFFVMLLPRIRTHRKTLRLISVGYVFYALAAVLSASRYFGNWYERMGGWIIQGIDPGLQEFYVQHVGDPNYELGFWLMDSLVEESLELIAALSLATALLLVLVDGSEARHQKGDSEDMMRQNGD